jgi:coenzyme F420-reducing hydrogenase beta subunit
LLKGTIEGKRLGDGSYNLTLTETVKGGDGSKLLGAHTGERATATGVPTEFLKHLQKEYKLKNTPEAIRQAGKIKTNQIGGIITGILEEVLESDKVEGETK